MPRLASDALAGLRQEADRVAAGWSPARWSGLDTVRAAAGKTATIRATLDPPADLAGEPLELTVTSIYPLEIAVDDEVVLSEPVPPVAAGPALIEIMKSIQPGRTAELSATVRVPAGQGGSWPDTWLGFTFTTPRLRARFEELDLAWARLALADELATDAGERAAVAAAARLVLDGALDAASLASLAQVLEPVADRVAALDVHVIGHAHIDLAWLWTWDDAREVIKRDIRSVLAIMRDYPEATFTHSQPAGYDVIRCDEPALFAEIQHYVQSGRWEPATAQWVECDSNLVSGEAMATQLLEGVTFTREHFGTGPRVCLAPDTFGHSANLPQLLAGAGVQVYYHMRANPGGSAQWPAYWWEGLDGTRVLACSTGSYLGAVTAGAIARAALEASRVGLPTALLFAGVGDHGGGPTRQGYDTLRRVGDAAGMPRAHCSTLGAYADQLIAAGVRLPVHRGESPAIFEGCYTSHVDVKQANRDAENRLCTAESLAALAGLPRDPELTSAWRDTCFHQFHDIIDGSAIAEAYAKTRADHAHTVSVTDRVIGRVLEPDGASVPGDTIVVTNPHGHDHQDIVVVDGLTPGGYPEMVAAGGETIPAQVTAEGLAFVACVPAFGTAHYSLVAGDFPAGEPSIVEGERYIRVETPVFRAAVRRDCGVLTSFVDKRTGAELVAFGMRRPSDYGDTARPDLGLNVFQLVDERPHFMSSWQYQEVHAEHTFVDGATTEVVESGPVRVVLRVTHRFRSSQIAQDIVFYRDLARVDFVARVGWQEPGDEEHGVPNLKVGFTPDIDESEAWFEVPYGAVRRRGNGQQVPALRWMDTGGPGYGVAVLNDGTYGHDVLGNRVRLTLVRTAYVPDPCSDRGEYTFRFSMVPHIGDWRAARVPHLAAAFNQPLLAGQGEHGAGWRPEIDVGDGLVTAVLRLARDGRGRVLRLAEAAGRPAMVSVGGLPAGSRVWESNVVEDRLCRAASRPWRLRPWEVRTWIVEG